MTDESSDSEGEGATMRKLPFPPVTRQHIMNCSYHAWWSKYREVTPKSRVLRLPTAFVDYLRADGIVLPDDHGPPDLSRGLDFIAGEGLTFSDDDNDDNDGEDVAAAWRPLHEDIKDTIRSLDGKVFPKLNWSAPKDATFMNANSMDCRTPQDVYLLLKSSDFITHDLEHAFDDTVDDPTLTKETITYHLVLRKTVGKWNPSMEFRCFVRGRKLLCMCQRDPNHFGFLFDMSRQLVSRIEDFFNLRLRDTFPDDNFAFDVYVPAPHDKVWLVDINPWAPRTDPLLFSWLEILQMPDPPELPEPVEGIDFVRLKLKPEGSTLPSNTSVATPAYDNEVEQDVHEEHSPDDASDVDSQVEEEFWKPELRLIKKTDPEAYNFNSPQYSAHKLPKDVVDAGHSGEGLREFARDWKKVLAKQQKEDAEAEASESD